MGSTPEFAKLVRDVVPKEGIHTNRPDRVKVKIKKALDKANIPSTTIRGIGRQVGDFAIVYSEKDGLFHADFELMAELDSKLPAKGKGGGGRKRGSKKKEDLFTGIHPSVGNMSLDTYASLTIGHLPGTWEKSDEMTHRWLSTDVSLLMNTLHTPFMAAQYFINQADQHLTDKPTTIYFTVIKAYGTSVSSGQILIGIGPVR